MDGRLSKTELARLLGVSRQSLYYEPVRKAKDEDLRKRIVRVLKRHPAYGYRRISLELCVNTKAVRRVMKKYDLVPSRRRKRSYSSGKLVCDELFPNRKKYLCPIQPNAIWSGDFTHFWFSGREMYLATVMDEYTREVLNWQIGWHHTGQLVLSTLKEAKRRRRTSPSFFHTDQGSEYTATARYYNTKRIHSKLKMPPRVFYRKMKWR